MTFPDEYFGWCHAENMYMEKYEFDHKKSGNQIRAEGML